MMDMARSLLKCMKVPSRFWGEAVRHSVYLLNRLPTKAMGVQTPYEAWNGRKPHLGHLKIFGSGGHVKNATPHQKRLDDRSTQMVYFGVEQGSKAHRMFNPQTNKLVISRDVVFEKSRSWDWKSSLDFSEDAVDNADEVTAQFYGSGDASVDGGESPQQGESGTSTSDGEAISIGEAVGTGLELGAVSPGTGGHSVTVPELTTESAAAIPEENVQGGDWEHQPEDLGNSSDYDEEPLRFRSLNEVYADTVEVGLASDSEMGAMLAAMEEPSTYQEAADDVEWVATMDSEIQSICKNGT